MTRAILLATVASFALTEAGLAQEVEEAFADAEVISVMATKSPIEAFEYPGQVTVIDREEILDFNLSTLQDVFQAIPGAQFNNGPRRTGDAPSIRGLGTSGVLIFLDGARQNFLSGHDGRFFVDPELVQAVEVVRGPTSALYGSGALGGVIATRTVTAQDVLEEGESVFVRLNTGFQSVNNEYRVGATAGWQSLDGKFDAIAHMTYRDSGSINLGNDFTLPADDEIVSSLLKATFRPSDDLEIYGSWMRYGADSTDPQNPQGANLAGRDNELVFRDARNTTLQGGLTWSPKDNSLIDFNAVVYYTKNGVEEDEVESPRTTDRELETIGIILDNRSRFKFTETTSMTLTYGGEYYNDRQRALDTETADQERAGAPDGETDFFGLFVQAELTASDLGPLPGEISIIPGVRYDNFASQQANGGLEIDEDEVSTKIGLSYKPVPQFMIFGNYAEGFRAPSLNDAFADGTHFIIPNLSAPPGPFGPSFVANLFIPNQDLEPEDSQTWEVGAGLDLSAVFTDDDRISIKGSYYDSDVSNLIGLDVNIPAGCFSPAAAFFAPCGAGAAFGNTSQNVNIQNAQITGFELEFDYDSEFAYVRGNFATIEGVDADNDEFLEGTLFPSTFFVDAGVKVPSVGLRVGTRLTIAGDFNDVNDPNQARDGYTVGDIYAVWQPQFDGFEGVRLDLGVDNVADTDFEVVSAGVSEAGRNFKIAVSWSKGF